MGTLETGSETHRPHPINGLRLASALLPTTEGTPSDPQLREVGMKAPILSFLMASAAVSGCATKRYATAEVGEVNKTRGHRAQNRRVVIKALE
jgi:hypothetical protein